MDKEIREYDGTCDVCGDDGDCITIDNNPAFDWWCPGCIHELNTALKAENARLKLHIDFLEHENARLKTKIP